jgi:NADPH2:quinone reductase
MRGLRYHDWGTQPIVEDLTEPTRRPGEVLVAMEAAALSHLDLTIATGTFGLRPGLPYVGGVEGSATVVEADDLPAGTKVLIRGGGIGLVKDGCWRERASVPTKAVTVLPAALAPAVAATFFVPTTTAYVALHDVGVLAAGERVVVTGAGGAVGSVVVQLALAAGAEVVAVVGRRSGATRVVVVEDGPDALEHIGAGRDASLLVDTVGGEALAGRCRWVQPGGRAVLIGYPAGTAMTIDLPSWLLDDVSLLPVNMIRREGRAREVAPALARQIAEGSLSVAVESLALDDAPDGLARLSAGRLAGRAAIAF